MGVMLNGDPEVMLNSGYSLASGKQAGGLFDTKRIEEAIGRRLRGFERPEPSHF